MNSEPVGTLHSGPPPSDCRPMLSGQQQQQSSSSSQHHGGNNHSSSDRDPSPEGSEDSLESLNRTVIEPPTQFQTGGGGSCSETPGEASLRKCQQQQSQQADGTGQRHYNTTTAALLTNFLLNNSGNYAGGVNGMQNGGGSGGSGLSYMEYTFPRGQRARRGHQQRLHEHLLSDHHSLLNGTAGSDSPEIHSSTGSEPIMFDYSRLGPHSLPAHHVTPPHPPPPSLYNTDSSLNNSLLSDHFSLLGGCNAGSGLTDTEDGDTACGAAAYSHHHSSTTFPSGYCTAGPGYCSQAASVYYPPPPPTVISEHNNGSGSSSSAAAANKAAAASLLYLQHRAQQAQGAYHISTPTASAHAHYGSQSSPPLLPPPPLAYLPPPSTSSTCPYPDFHLVDPNQHLYHHSATPPTMAEPSVHTTHPSNLVTIYNQATGATRSFCSAAGAGPNGGPKGFVPGHPHPHHHHHHHLYHYHLPPSPHGPTGIKLLTNTPLANSLQPAQSKTTPKTVPLYATLNPSVGRIESATGLPDLSSSGAIKSRTITTGNPNGPTANPDSYPHHPANRTHLNGNCIANHEVAGTTTRQPNGGGGGQNPNGNLTSLTSTGLDSLQRDPTTGQPSAVQSTTTNQAVQSQSQAEAAAMAELTRKAAEQEAQLRELKGYEASYQYQPRSALLAGSAGKYGDGSGPPLMNSNAIPGADKRSCSQWRMTLFVFYWIIWIVFLIGVVIIVAANARTASGSFGS